MRGFGKIYCAPGMDLESVSGVGWGSCKGGNRWG